MLSGFQCLFGVILLICCNQIWFGHKDQTCHGFGHLLVNFGRSGANYNKSMWNKFKSHYSGLIPSIIKCTFESN